MLPISFIIPRMSASQWLHRPYNAPTQFYRVGKKLSVKAELAINSHIVDVSGHCISVSLTLGLKNWISVLVPFGMVFVNCHIIIRMKSHYNNIITAKK